MIRYHPWMATGGVGSLPASRVRLTAASAPAPRTHLSAKALRARDDPRTSSASGGECRPGLESAPVTKSGSNARKQEARQLAAAEGIPYTEALRRLSETSPDVPPHADRPCPADCPHVIEHPVNDQLPPWAQPQCPVHQPDAHAGWHLEGAYPRSRRLFLTQGPDAGVMGQELEPGSVHTIPALVAFRSRLSAPAKAEFDSIWDLSHDSEASGTEIVLTLDQADEPTTQATTAAMEREAVRHEFVSATGLLDYNGGPYDEFANWPGRLQTSDLRAEAAYLEEVIETATALLAMVLTHLPERDTRAMPDPRFRVLRELGRPATAEDVYRAAGWELPDTSDTTP